MPQYPYIEHAGDFGAPFEAVKGEYGGQVIVDVGRLDARVREAIPHAADREALSTRRASVPPAAVARCLRHPEITRASASPSQARGVSFFERPQEVRRGTGVRF